MRKLDPDDPRPPYRQIADQLQAAIDSGELGPGQQLPALSALTSEYGVSLGTAKSALAVLRDAGLIVSRQGKGSYVRTRRDKSRIEVDASDLEAMRRELAELRNRLEVVERKLADR
ncbi:GntR family transcriptional regulator [Saccharopolyspora hattusasensis]|uniref:GntR family transcriptional regulator n=1 Tax=Saccharopolyspora hattusasensis TaxID=1128679 RepID=UPI003D99304C